MIYCMSDIHGELDRFKAMLDLINFSSDDTLYIIGDVIDRHPGGVEILKIIKDTPNMFMPVSYTHLTLPTNRQEAWRSSKSSRTHRTCSCY